MDPLRRHAARDGLAEPAIHRRTHQTRHRPRAAVRLAAESECRGDRPRRGGKSPRRRRMSPAVQGSIVLIVTLIVLLSGAPVAFGLGAIAISFLVIFQGFDALRVAAETFYSGLHDFTLVSIP